MAVAKVYRCVYIVKNLEKAIDPGSGPVEFYSAEVTTASPIVTQARVKTVEASLLKELRTTNPNTGVLMLLSWEEKNVTAS